MHQLKCKGTNNNAYINKTNTSHLINVSTIRIVLFPTEKGIFKRKIELALIKLKHFKTSYISLSQIRQIFL